MTGSEDLALNRGGNLRQKVPTPYASAGRALD